MNPRLALLPIALALALACACASPNRDGAAPASIFVPGDWDRISPGEFESLLVQIPTAGNPVELGPVDRAELARALGEGVDRSQRAALLLAACGARASRAHLVDLLAARRTPRSRGDDAAELVAAASLAKGPLDPRQEALVWSLVEDPLAVHPSLPVRVELAIAMLGRDQGRALRFLLQVVRHDTEEAARRGEFLTDSRTTAWPRWRAARAVEAEVGAALDYDPDAPPSERGQIARRLETMALEQGRLGTAP